MLKLFIMLFVSVMIYGCKTNFNQPETLPLVSKEAESQVMPLKFINSSGKVAFEITGSDFDPETGLERSSVSGNLSDNDLKSLNKILKEIESASEQEKKLQDKLTLKTLTEPATFPDRINFTLRFLFRQADNYSKLLYHTKSVF